MNRSIRVGSREIYVDNSPLKTTRFLSHHRFELSRPDSYHMLIRPSRAVRLLGWSFFIVGFFISTLAILAMLSQKGPGFFASLLLLMPGIVLAISGKALIGPQYLFDSSTNRLTINHFWRRRHKPLEEIIAVQLIDAGQFESGNESSEAFQSYQLNLILNNSNLSRFFVAYNFDATDAQMKAKALAEFLHVPLASIFDKLEERTK